MFVDHRTLAQGPNSSYLGPKSKLQPHILLKIQA